MEHGLHMPEGQGFYLLASDWHEVQPDDFIWMALLPQHFYYAGWTETAHLLYKDINQDMQFD